MENIPNLSADELKKLPKEVNECLDCFDLDVPIENCSHRENIPNLSADELKKLPKEVVHEAYKDMLHTFIVQFYWDATEAKWDLSKMEDLTLYARYWLETKIKPPRDDWNPGDQAT